MNKCFNTLTNWTLVINFIATIISLFIKIMPLYLVTVFINMLLFIIIAGNIIIITHGKNIANKCKTTKKKLDFTNIIQHIIIPICFIVYWCWFIRNKSNINQISKPFVFIMISIIISFFIAAIYFVLMKLDITFDYDLDQKILWLYIIGYIILTIGFCILSPTIIRTLQKNRINI